MTPRSLLGRNLRHFAAANLLVAAGVAVATAAVTGALMVGDSVRGSLADMAVRRLGPVTHAIVATGFVDASLAKRMNNHTLRATGAEAVAAIILRGSAARADETARASGVQIAGADGLSPTVEPDTCIINGALADALDITVGEPILLSVPRQSQLPGDAPLARRERKSRLRQLRLTVAGVEREPGFVSQFALLASQRAAPRAWVNLAQLQQAVGQAGKANTLLIARDDPAATMAMFPSLDRILAGEFRPADVGLAFTDAGDGRVALTSPATYLPPAVVAAVADEKVNRVLIALINTVAVTSGDGKKIHYAVAAGLSDPPGGPLAADEIALNQWTADQLGAAVGDRIVLSYYRRETDGTMVETRSDAPEIDLTFGVARIVPMTGLGADPTLTPTVRGLTDADSVADWDPPADLKIDKDLITDADEAYWDEHHAAPKLLLNYQTARRLWGGPFGNMTSARFAAADADRIRAALAEELTPAALGLQVKPIRAEQLAAAAGSTDFAQLYVALSFYLIIAAALLTALLCRLAVEQRARQYGLLAAIGFAPVTIRRLAMAEAMLVALIGSLVGLVGAIGYTAAIMAGLRTWWFDAVGTSALSLHVRPWTLAIGLIASLGIAAIAVGWGVRRVGRTPVAALLAGRWSTPAMTPRRRGMTGTLVTVGLTIAAAAMMTMSAVGVLDVRIGYLVGGAVLLAAGLGWLSQVIRPKRSASARIVGPGALARLAAANAGRRPTRTLLAAGLLAFTSFSLVTIAAFRQNPPTDTHLKHSGAGGFTLIGRADITLPNDMATPSGRRLAGAPNSDDAIWSEAGFVGLRRRGGQDASCLNITRPTDPTILAVPAGAFDGRFRFADAIEKTDDPWRLLDATDPHGPVPIIADEATAKWILHLAPGDTLEVSDAQGRPVKLRLVATLAGSIFQSELLMAEASFRRLWPSQTGVGVLLAATDPAGAADLQRAMAIGAGDYGLAVEPTSALLGRLAEVANTYLATFQTLGAMGLLLGVAGLTVVLLRNLLERRSELALLAALGMSRRRRRRLLLIENAFTLTAGLGVGFAVAMAALAAARPAGTPINWLVLIGTMAGILLVGLATQAAAATWAGRTVRPADLRRE